MRDGRWRRATFVHSYQPSFISKLQIKFAEFPYLLYFVSNRVYSTREPVADWSTEIEGSFARIRPSKKSTSEHDFECFTDIDWK
jgi:hypothetical protein